jgi:ribosomal protein L11 methyltransferase
MPYRMLRFDAPADAAECWADALLAAGALAVDIAPADADDDGGAPPARIVSARAGAPPCRLSALFDATALVEAVLQRAAAALELPPPDHRLESVADADWVREAQAQFAPLRVTDRLLIVPSWHEPVDASAINIRLDPGTAFGTGSHATTRLCLQWLAQNMAPRASVLDYGCGSGILAIAAAKLGAGCVVGVDADAQAVAVSRENARANGIAAQFAAPDEIPAQAFDVVVANILANALELLAPLLAQRVRPRGHIVLSGILESQSARVAAAYAQWFNIAPWGSADGWIALAGVRIAA